MFLSWCTRSEPAGTLAHPQLTSGYANQGFTSLPEFGK